jgi:superfamily II DNA or RNA helicase
MVGINDLLVPEPPLAYGAMAKYPSSQALKFKFMVKSRFGDDVTLYAETKDGKHLLLPRAVCPVGDNDLRVKGPQVDFKCTAKPKNEEQKRCFDEAMALLEKGESFIVQAPTGWGKTVWAIMVAAALGVPTLIVCTKDDLVKQWAERVLQFTNLHPKQIGLIQQDYCDPLGKVVTVASIHSLAIEGRYPASLREMFGLIIYDECHRLGAESFAKVAGMFSAFWRIGLTATPKRVDGKELVFHAHIGAIRVVATAMQLIPKVLIYETGWKVPMVRQGGEVQKMRITPGRSGHVSKMMSKSRERNRLIVFLVHKAYEAGRRIVVFSTLTEHLEELERLYISAGVPASQIGRYYGTDRNGNLEHAATRRVINATPQKMGEGTDVPWIDTCLLAMPLANVEQIVGRILREYPDKKEPVVFDLRDDDSGVYRNYGKSRDVFYARIKSVAKVMARQDVQSGVASG